MRFFILFFLMLSVLKFNAQNDLRLISLSGETFEVFVGGKMINTMPEASVLIKNILLDTLTIQIKFEKIKPIDAVIFLLDKGEKTRDKEYNYKVFLERESAAVVFIGSKEIVRLPEPLVPKNTIEKKH